ncbi:MAG: DUF2911 domain-containing protein [Longimicrobiales bacterium]|nr:DUF2911 domain-containing protein [Longimicrobiales bacterium]
MNTPRKRTLLATASLAVAVVACGGEDAPPHEGPCWSTSNTAQLAERASPLDSAMVTLAGERVRVCYGRPAVREREVMGALVPFGDAWRLGANEATSIHLPFDARLGDLAVPAGDYSLYVVPQADSWTVAVNGVVERWGIPVNADVTAEDVGTFSVPTEVLEQPVEVLTMRFEEAGPDAAELVVEWERTRVRIPVQRAAEG